MQRHATFAIPLGTRDLDSVQTARAHDLDALRAEPHRVLHRALHRTAKHDAFFKLLRDRIGDQLGIELWLAYFFDIDVHRHAEHFLQRGLSDSMSSPFLPITTPGRAE